MAPNDPFPGPPHIFHVELVTVTLKLTDEDMQQHYLEFIATLEVFEAYDIIHFPLGTPWVEIWPEQGRPWMLMDWLDQPFLAPSDQIILTLKDPNTHEPIPGTEVEYHVDKVTVAMNLTSMYDEMMHIVKFEGSLVQFKYHHWGEPWGTQWHEVNPTYCRQWCIIDWYDSQPNGILDYCDFILMVDKETGVYEEFHVESLSTDIFVSPLGDVAVTDVITFKTVCEKTFSPINIVFENHTIYINATVENQGNFDETFDVIAKYDGNHIQTIVNLFLAAHTSTNVNFMWDTHGVAKGSYNITVEAVLPTDVDPGDNTKTYGPVKVTWLGDLDGDFDVDQFDYWAFCGAFIDYYTPPYVKDPLCDFDDDCDIDQFDYWTFCSAFIDYYKT